MVDSKNNEGFKVALNRVALMLSCYNRKEKTRQCLLSLKEQCANEQNLSVDIYVFDDNSTDGTREMLNELFPEIIVIQGDGNSFWCKSMYILMKVTSERNYDFYLMINDDVSFYKNALYTMFHSYEKAGGGCGIVGTTRNSLTGIATYGGRNELRGALLEPDVNLKKCQWTNWNCFLVDAEIVSKIGIIDGKYKHSWGDYDYSFRMVKNGIPIYIAEDYVGECELNSVKGSFQDATLKRSERLRKLISPKGMPFGSYIRFNTKTKGIRELPRATFGYISIIIYILANKAIE